MYKVVGWSYSLGDLGGAMQRKTAPGLLDASRLSVPIEYLPIEPLVCQWSESVSKTPLSMR